ncbi:MAG TPA: hypothetical protein VJT71_15670 [Pyrinomonadaceae bacterium]|nr:hypothetical protein [Pyrinomonadaceae bacterium]
MPKSIAMGKFVRLVVFFGVFLTVASGASAQVVSRTDRVKLMRARRTADSFVERFRQTFDFGKVWKEFQVSDPSCNYMLDGLWDREDQERAKLTNTLIEEHYIALANCIYLDLAYRLNTIRAQEDDDDAEKRLPKVIQLAEKKMEQINSRTPQNSSEAKVMISELRELANVWRKHMPTNRMRSRMWRANIRTIVNREDGIAHLSVGEGGEWNRCIPRGTKYYIVDSGLFYFYFVEEEGHMKVARFGLGN